MSVAFWVAVALIGGFGSVARFMVDRSVTRIVRRPFPFGTLAVNLTGAVALGVISGLGLGHVATLLAGTALVGAYTTFSTWILETYRLAEERRYWPAAANIVISLVLGIAAAFLGQWIGGQL